MARSIEDGAAGVKPTGILTARVKFDSSSIETHGMIAPPSLDKSSPALTEGATGDEQRASDRRERPTRPWDGWFGPLRRAKGRRNADLTGYVDVYDRRDVALLLAIFLLNVGDAFFTLLWLNRGGREANPVMNFFLDISPEAFIATKCFVVGLWLVVILVHKNFRFARLGLKLSLGAYALLLLIHFGIIAFDISPPVELEASAAMPATTMP